jgi:hypothetical protein
MERADEGLCTGVGAVRYAYSTRKFGADGWSGRGAPSNIILVGSTALLAEAVVTGQISRVALVTGASSGIGYQVE